MKTLNLTYTDKKSLGNFILLHKVDNDKYILVQIFTGIVKKKFIEELILQILSILPTAKIIGSTSDGIINNNFILQKETLISFSTFRTTKIEIFISKDFHDSYILGENLALQFPRDKNLKVAICFSDDSLSFAGNIPVGIKVQFGYGNTNNISYQRNKIVKILKTYPIESMFIYSCMARRRLLGKNVYKELEFYTTIASTTGFFTYGEFYHYSNNTCNNDLLNETATILTLSEDSLFKQSSIDSLPNNNDNNEFTNTIDALSHLIYQTSYELNELNFNQKLIIHEELTKNRQKEQMLMQQSKQASMGDMIDIIAHQWKQPLNIISLRLDFLSELALDGELVSNDEIIECGKKIKSQIQHLTSILDDFRGFFRPTKYIE